MNPSQSTSFYAAAYFTLPPKQKNICLLLYSMESGKRKGKYTSVFPSKNKMAARCGCSKSTVKRFNKKTNGLILSVKKRFDAARNGRQTTNAYELDNKLFEAMVWLDRNNLLYASKRQAMIKIRKLQISEEKCPNLNPTPPLIWPPIILNPNLKKEEYPNAYVNKKIENIKMPIAYKVRASQYSEFCIERSIEDALWYQNKGNKIHNAGAFLISRLEHWKRKKDYEN